MPRLKQQTFISFCFLLFCLPLPLATHRAWAWSVMEVWVAVQTLLLIFIYYRNFPWQRVKQFAWLLVPLCLFQVWVAIQTLPMSTVWMSWLSPNALFAYRLANSTDFTLSLDRYATNVGLLKGVAYTLFTFNTILLVNNVDRLRTVLYVLVASGTFQAFYAALEILLHVKETWVFGMEQGDRANGTFVYHNHLANYLMMTLCMGTGLIVSQLHQSESGSWHIRLKRWISAVLATKMIVRLCLVVMVIALVMTRSRMGNMAFFSVTLIGGIVAFLFYKNRPRALTVLIISLLAIDTFIVGTVFGLDKVKDRLEATSTASETRDQVVEWSLNLIKDYPFSGTGLGSFYGVFPNYTQYNIGYYNFAHNDYIQFASEVGIPATMLLGGMVLFALCLSFKVIRTRNSKTLKGTALGCFMAIIGMLIHITVDFNLQAPANAMTFILILVLAGSSLTIQVEKKNR